LFSKILSLIPLRYKLSSYRNNIGIRRGGKLMKKPQTVMLDAFYAMRLHNEGETGVDGEVIMVGSESGQVDTHLFDVPSMQDEQAAKEWALRALQAYREG
jgi:hypothetical protein